MSLLCRCPTNLRPTSVSLTPLNPTRPSDILISNPVQFCHSQISKSSAPAFIGAVAPNHTLQQVLLQPFVLTQTWAFYATQATSSPINVPWRSFHKEPKFNIH
ncbi:hypothetical protein ATANTOWER_002836 [Ataeniobius toweri]|uniref:Uncharacterized protein n=1 Tax=Ataeniobius toweri TaxID=208326 RepID=A0ABU7AY39_9TELE|nr:hypothetical protein [Ataeniobius toweri]